MRLPTTVADLAGLLAAWSRRCVGWPCSRSTDPHVTLPAVDRALTDRQPGPERVHHSDRGVHYASAASIARLPEIDAAISMAAVGNPDENAKAERVCKTLKREEISQPLPDVPCRRGHPGTIDR